MQQECSALALLLSRVSDAFAALDRDDCYTYVNEQAARVFGKPTEDMIGHNIWALFPDAVGQAFYQAYQAARATQTPTQVENYYPPWDRWIESRIYPASDGVSIFFHDVTERKRSEAMLKGQSHLLELITQGASLQGVLEALLRLIEEQCAGTRGSILLLDDDGIHLRHGAAPSLPESFTGPIDGAAIGPQAGSCGTAAFTRQAVMTEDIATDTSWDHWRALALPLDLRACWSTPIFDGERRVLGTFALYYREPAKLRERDQSIVSMATHIAAIAIAHERDQRARRQSESRYRRLVDCNVIGVMILDHNATITEANDEFLRIIGASREELAAGALRWATLTHADEAQLDAELFERLAVAGTCPSVDRECLHKSGQHVWLRVTAARLEGREDDAICLVEDVTERREQARLREKNVELEERSRAALEASRLKSEFLASMSHELRTPLNAIIGFSELLVDGTVGEVSAKQHECLTHVLTSGRHLLQLINDVLDLAKVESGKLDLFPVEFELPAELEELCSIARTLAQEKHIALRLRCDPRVVRVVLDPQKLKQVLFNLLSNAVKFTEDGGSIDVETRALEPDKLEIRVCDTGIGICRDDLPRLFQEFRQLHRGQSRQEGTGLGLVLAKRLVESQQGELSVESRLGEGSTFCVRLPRVLRRELARSSASSV